MNNEMIQGLRERGARCMELASNAGSTEEWKALHESNPGMPFTWGECWKQCTQYTVNDMAAEIGFYFHVMGLRANAMSDTYAMFTSPDRAFYLAFVPATDDTPATHPDTLSIEFMVEDIAATAAELEGRGAEFVERPAPCGEGSPMYSGFLRTPNGIRVRIWGMVNVAEPAGVEEDAAG